MVIYLYNTFYPVFQELTNSVDWAWANFDQTAKNS